MNILRDFRHHRTVSLSLCPSLLTTYFCYVILSLLSLRLVFSSVLTCVMEHMDRQPSSSVSTHTTTARRGQRERCLSFPGVLFLLWLFIYSTPAGVKAALPLRWSHSSSTCPSAEPRWQYAWAPVWGWVQEECCLASLRSPETCPPPLPCTSLHSHVWQENLWLLTSATGELKLSVAVASDVLKWRN